MAAEPAVRPFLVLLEGAQAAAVASAIAGSVPAGTLRVHHPAGAGPDLLEGDPELDRWWEAQPPGCGRRPVVLVGHRPTLGALLAGLDADFVVAVPSWEQAAAYAGLVNVRPALAGDVRRLAGVALELAGLRRPALGAPPPDPFWLLSQLPPPPAAPRPAGDPWGADRDLPSPGPPGGAQERLRGLLERLGPGRGNSVPAALGQAVLARKPVLVAVVSRKGGVGKTASAAAIAAILGEAVDRFGHSAALIDANIGNPDAWGRLQVRGRAPTVRELMARLAAGREPPAPVWSQTPALAVYPESRESAEGYTTAQVERLNAYLVCRHAAIVVDLPNRLPSFTSGEAALAAAWIALAQVVVIPTTADPTALLGAVEYLAVPSLRERPVVVPYIVPRLRQIRTAPEVRRLLDRLRRRAAVVEVPDDDRATLALIRRRAITEVGHELRRAYVALATRVVAAAQSPGAP